MTLRFPDGDVEHRSTPEELPVGAVIRARRTLWRVQEHVGQTVFLEAVEEDEPVDGAPTPSTPQVVPAGLDEPLTVEILSAA